MSTPLSLTPPATDLVAPAEVEPVSIEDLHDDLPGPPVAPGTKKDLQRRAHEHASALSTIDPMSPQFQSFLADVDAIGARTITSSSEVSNKLLDSPESSLADRGGKDTPVAANLTQLRRTIDDLDPSQMDFKRKLLGVIPFGSKVVDYQRRFESQRSHLDAIVERLSDSRDELRKDNAVLEREKARLWEMLSQLKHEVYLVRFLEREVESLVADLETSDPERAAKIRDSALFHVRQRHQDLMTHAAVSVQGYLAIEMVVKNNTELSKGVQRATQTTMAALTTSLMTSQALANQGAVNDQVTAVNEMTSNLIDRNAAANAAGTARIQKQAGQATIDIESLKKAFTAIYESMDAVDEYRAEAAESMSSSITALHEVMSEATHRFSPEADDA